MWSIFFLLSKLAGDIADNQIMFNNGMTKMPRWMEGRINGKWERRKGKSDSVEGD